MKKIFIKAVFLLYLILIDYNYSNAQCLPDCITDNWVFPITEEFILPDCDPDPNSDLDCKVIITWTYRDACNGLYQDLQILRIQVYQGCYTDCELDEIFKKCLVAAMNYTITLNDWEPQLYPDCSSKWRVQFYQCMAVWDIYVIGPNGEIIRHDKMLGECEGFNCCTRELTVCRLASGALNITPGTLTQPSNPECENYYQYNPLVGSTSQCFSSCQLTYLSGVYYPGYRNTTVGKTMINQNNNLKIKLKFNNDNVKISIDSNEKSNSKFQIIDIKGSVISTKFIQISEGTNNLEYPLEEFGNGTYILQISLNGKQIIARQFGIVN